MFALNFTGSNADAITALGNMTSGQASGVEPQLASLVTTYVALCISANGIIDVGTQYTGDLRIKIHGSWKPNSMRLAVEVDAVELHEGKILAIPCAPPDITTTV